MNRYKWLLAGTALSAVILAVFLSRSRGPAADPRAASPAPTPLAPAPTLPGTIAPLLTAPQPAAAPAVAKYMPPTGPIRADQLDPQTLLKRFAAWSDAYVAAAPEQRAAMLREGGALAEVRREAMRELILKNPEEAIKQAVPYDVRKQLPREIVALLEVPVSGRGELAVFGAYPFPGQKLEQSYFRKVVLNGQTYDACVYGRRKNQRSGTGLAMWGVALDGRLALAESPLRILGSVEAKDLVAAGKAPADPTCAVSALPVPVQDVGKPPAPAVAAKTAATLLQPTLADLAGQVMSFCKPKHAVSYGRLLASHAAGASGGHGGGASAVTGANARGTRTTLYMRLAFPDDPREPISEQGAYADLDDLNRFFVSSSHHTFNLVGVGTPVLVLPYPKKWYEDKIIIPPSGPALPPGELYSHAYTAAAAANRRPCFARNPLDLGGILQADAGETALLQGGVSADPRGPFLT